jgi:putative transposase
MKKSAYTGSQIMTILRQSDNGSPVPELCAEKGMNSAAIYKCRAKYAGVSTAMITRLKELKNETMRLKEEVC